MTLDFNEIAKRWQKAWEEKKVFESDADSSRKKFFVSFPYPYVNGYLHLGHSYTSMRVEAFARYKRMRGYNVLFAQGWHATGSPIDGAAKRVAEGDQKQIEILKMQGFTDKDIPKFKDPKHWVDVFSKAAKEDFSRFGFSIDWRREFITTSMNPYYDKFIKWQFEKLREKNYVVKGEHPVVWCPKDKNPVSDHARLEGEGIMPEEMVLLKFKYGDKILPAATFRPETIFGVTNMWLNPELDYAEVLVDGEKWIVADKAIPKLKDQKHKVEEIGTISGKEFIGKTCKNPATGKEVPILPASFVTPDTGTGVVMSVPSHAPYDWMALKDVQQNPKKFGVDEKLVKDIKPIGLIKIEGYKEHPAIEECERRKIKDQKDDIKLEEATGEIYKKEFHTGKLTKTTGKYEGLTVQEAKPKIIADFTKQKFASLFYELISPVVCRCSTACYVKIVSDQWFLAYGNEEWKKLCHKALAKCKLYPEKVRQQFENVIDWLKDWACTREQGLGTRLPWDEKWLIESLSDSTIYLAFYTIAHILQKQKIDAVDSKLFDYIFLGKGRADDQKTGKKIAESMHEEFNYWYPMDFRNSGKDLVQNHLTFFLFNHAAIFPEKQWPAGIGVNGFINVEKIKMSKSKGNFKTLRDLIENFTPDVTRISVLSTGEELTDVNWEADSAFTIKNKLEQWYDFCLQNYGKNNGKGTTVDSWMISQLNSCVKDSTAAMDETLYRTAILKGFFDLQRHLKWYLRRTAGAPNGKVIDAVIDAQTKMLAPFTPHLCEEIWNKLGKKGFIALEEWPSCDESKILPELEQSEELISTIMEDITQVQKLAKIEKPKKITLISSSPWKAKAITFIKNMSQQTKNAGEVIKAAMQNAELKKHGKEIAQLVPRLMKDVLRIPSKPMNAKDELIFLQDAVAFLKKEFNCEIIVVSEEKSTEKKAGQAMPGKPAIVLQ